MLLTRPLAASRQPFLHLVQMLTPRGLSVLLIWVLGPLITLSNLAQNLLITATFLPDKVEVPGPTPSQIITSACTWCGRSA